VTAQTVKHANVEQIVNMYFMRLPLSDSTGRFADDKRSVEKNPAGDDLGLDDTLTQ
jgi:hypothetical protein